MTRMLHFARVLAICLIGVLSFLCIKKYRLYRMPVRVRGAPVRGERNIFFVETSCALTDFPIPKAYTTESGLWLSPQTACSIEAAARSHPERPVTFVHTCPFPLTDHGVTSMPSYALAVFSMPNVRLWSEGLETILTGSPLCDLLQKRDLAESRWSENVFTDLLRFDLLWRYGGTFVDADVILTRDMGELRNFVCTDENERLCPSIVDFSTDECGEAVAYENILEMMEYRPEEAYDAPSVITRALKKHCQVEKLTRDPGLCGGFRVLDGCAVFPGSVSDRQRLLKQRGADKTAGAAGAAAHALGVRARDYGAARNASLSSRRSLAKITRRACPGVTSAVGDLL